MQLHRGANVDQCGSYVGIIFLHNTLWVSSMSKLLPSSVSFFSELLITHRFIHIKLNNEAKQNSNLVQLSGSPRREHVEENNVSVGIRVLGLITRDDLPNWEHD